MPAENFQGDKPGNMMSRYWQRQAEKAVERWQAEYEARKTPQQIAAYQSRLREKFLEALGGLPERTPLQAEVTGTIRREGYRVEKVIFQSRPKHSVTALLFVPEASRFKPPCPGVLAPCGRARSAKAHHEYQTVGTLLAIHGMAALVFDPIDQGERSQYLGEGGWPQLWGTRAHSLLGIGSTLLGRNTARFEIWDGMRAIDYLQSRPEVDAKRIGCTGNSGGGTQTSYLVALDDRIKAAAPSCYLCGFPALLRTIGPQDAEHNIFGQLAFGMDHADYVTMRAPRPALICAATKDFFDIRGTWKTFRYAKRLYTRLGFAERVDLLENDAKHNYNATQREGVARWMSRWLRGKDEPIVEPEIKFIVTLVEALAWPIAAIVIILLLKRPIGELILTLRKVTWRDVEAEFGRGLEEISEDAEEARLPPIDEVKRIPPPEPEPVLDSYTRLAEVSPVAAVTEAWHDVERACGYAHEKLGGHEPASMIPEMVGRRMLDQHTFKIFKQLRSLRNRTAHEGGPEISASKALEYVTLPSCCCADSQGSGRA